eukprot:5062555-Lingulodinium_polyedra.AAC.1
MRLVQHWAATLAAALRRPGSPSSFIGSLAGAVVQGLVDPACVGGAENAAPGPPMEPGVGTRIGIQLLMP